MHDHVPYSISYFYDISMYDMVAHIYMTIYHMVAHTPNDHIPYGKLVTHMTMCYIVFHILHDHVPYGRLVRNSYDHVTWEFILL